MTLNQDERELLRRIAEADKPVAMSDFFHVMYPPNFDASVGEEHPDRVVWRDHQFDLYGASIKLWQNDLVRVVHPANGERPDLVEVTDAGRAALA
ncbi:hypothetical protein [Streptomyces sp. ML-6]|uniref:hypothetical protein n=1 Tax=Streptomyces sp. ML-6 TaxID=2982693 RepID=UPI0024C09F55|nr:hypothetical protein [Streptomyces sp. ML-6]MDK0525099.1 hypothetical protein [Streptomyces sp. ML-6]